MSEKPMGKNVISAGRDINADTVLAGDNATLHVGTQKINLPDPSSFNINEEIEALKAILAVVGGDRQTNVNSAMMEIEGELNKPDEAQDKDLVGETLERALSYAQKGEKFTELIEKIKPHVLKATSWLGENWNKLLSLIGISV